MKNIQKKGKRWELAQTYELNWWQKRKGGLRSEYYKHSAIEIKNYLEKEHRIISEETKILEVGSGMCGILTFLNESKSRFAIDPLEDYYSSVSEFVAKRDCSVMYYKAKGENIPFENKTFDLIILDNVLDHCEDPVLVLDEINRVLGEKGIIYFRQNTYNCYGKFMRSLMELFIIDKGHPFTFTKRKLKRMFAKYDLKITHKNRIGYFPAWWGELTSKTIKDKIKAFLFITRDKVTYVLRKN